MTKLATFAAWLLAQEHRHDDLGKLAVYWREVTPGRVSSPAGIEHHLDVLERSATSKSELPPPKWRSWLTAARDEYRAVREHDGENGVQAAVRQATDAGLEAARRAGQPAAGQDGDEPPLTLAEQLADGMPPDEAAAAGLAPGPSASSQDFTVYEVCPLDRVRADVEAAQAPAPDGGALPAVQDMLAVLAAQAAHSHSETTARLDDLAVRAVTFSDRLAGLTARLDDLASSASGILAEHRVLLDEMYARTGAICMALGQLPPQSGAALEAAGQPPGTAFPGWAGLPADWAAEAARAEMP